MSAAIEALNAAREASDHAALGVAVAADMWLTDIDRGRAAGIAGGDAYLRRKVAAWRDTEQARTTTVAALQALLRTPERVVTGPADERYLVDEVTP